MSAAAAAEGLIRFCGCPALRRAWRPRFGERRARAALCKAESDGAARCGAVRCSERCARPRARPPSPAAAAFPLRFGRRFHSFGLRRSRTSRLSPSSETAIRGTQSSSVSRRRRSPRVLFPRDNARARRASDSGVLCSAAFATVTTELTASVKNSVRYHGDLERRDEIARGRRHLAPRALLRRLHRPPGSPLDRLALSAEHLDRPLFALSRLRFVHSL